jgi:hypothetical protein
VGRVHDALVVQRVPLQFQFAPPAEIFPCLRALFCVMAVYGKDTTVRRCRVFNERRIVGCVVSTGCRFAGFTFITGCATCGWNFNPGAGTARLYGEPAIATVPEKRNTVQTVALWMPFFINRTSR